MQEIIELLEPDYQGKVGRGRPRVILAMCLWAGFLVCVLRGMGSQFVIWCQLALTSLWDCPLFPITDQAVYKRLEQGGTGDLERLFSQVSAVMRTRLEPCAQHEVAPFATEVAAIDTTTLDLDARKLPVLREVPKGDRRLIPGKLAGVFDIRYQQWRHVRHIVNPVENDKVTARSLLTHVRPGALVLADLGYFVFEWFDDMTDDGYLWLSRLRKKTSYEVLHTFYKRGDTFDGLVFLGAYRADRAKHAVRLITYRKGRMASSPVLPHSLSVPHQCK